MQVADRYRRFAAVEARGYSPSYDRLATSIAGDRGMLALIGELPPVKQQPNLLFGAVRYLAGPVNSFGDFKAWALANWATVSATMLNRTTQTNEPGRCATLLPILAMLPAPLALLEIGASAGLCLYPDRYHYTFGTHTVGNPDSPVRLSCQVSGPVPVPARLPEIAWRAGVDLNPLDVANPDDRRWLEALIWPEHRDRLARFRAAAEVAQAEPAPIVRGDLNTELAHLSSLAPPQATLVIFHSAVLAYVPVPERQLFVDRVQQVAAHWISNEAPDVLPQLAARTSRPPRRTGSFLAALDSRPLAWAGTHGQDLEWIPSPT
jgi:hypothetical protein